ncbi:EAL domain-containing protein [uncultured Roseobacter sp.]|uniref:putative bifunctional diguanylate cyclase/phosphodiesterase n=1 Tax=uncultured Roseobacter sp. TaxID=114847 RepID=UPI0026194A4F|nr:EAL domain-containing protein [uncultured Roseobacter sp.]
MAGKNNWSKWSARILSARVFFFVSAVIAWPFMAEYELFEEFYEFSRAHEDWDLDEFGLLVINLTLALMFSSIYKSKQLKAAITAREDEHQRAERNARHDPLTGLLNRRAFAEALSHLEDDGSKVSRFIAMVDLDRFKSVNDLHGHAAGDAILREVATRLEEVVGEKTTVARLGGDEFAVIFERGLDANGIERIARRLLHSMERAFDYGQLRLHISCSVGLAQWADSARHSLVLGQADKALYTAKNLGRARFAWYDAQLDSEATERARIETDLREAISSQKIEPWYQPIVDIENQAITGFEVLARWNHPERGDIPPTVFIEIAEDSGQIDALGRSLLRRACEAARDWDPRLSLSFNLSALQFHDPALVTDITSILEESDFDPRRLTIEVTESLVIRDFQVAREKLNALKAVGISVALDDFGTGYSSLASLRQLPFDRIKIDRGFITDIGAQPQNQKIVTGIMSLARGLDLDVTAEGIETAEDLDFIRSLDCGLGQGFLFDKAVSGEEIAWLLETKWVDLQPNDAPYLANPGAQDSKAV